MKKNLTKREKMLIGVSLVSLGAASYFGYKYMSAMKTTDRLVEDINLLKFLTVEGELVPKALQNAKNKLQRMETKIARGYISLEKYPNDNDTLMFIEKCKNEMKKLMDDISKAEQLQDMLESKENLYA